jgi:glucose/arabinose dehydrogenase
MVTTAVMLADAGPAAGPAGTGGFTMRLARALPIAAALCLALVAPAAHAAPKVQTVKGGLDRPTAFTFAPNGRIWFIEKDTGAIRILNAETGGVRLFKDLTGVDGTGERGGLGIALHPDFPAIPFVYVYVTRIDDGVLVNELLRIRSDGGAPAATKVLFSWRPSGATNHNGGRILFGPDGMLYVVIGENADPALSQRLGTIRGKILRLRPDGSAPATNPFGSRVWAFGIRNSFGMAFDPATGLLWETENGPGCNDEINRIRRGGNFAWGPHQACGSLAAPRDTNRDGPNPRILPAAFFRDTIGITGAAFCHGCGLPAYDGDLLFGDVNTAQLWHATMTADRRSIRGRSPVVGLGTVVYSMEVGPRHRIYFSGPTGIYRLARG